MTVTGVRDLPEQGQVVSVRQRNFVVADVRASDLPLDVLTPVSSPQHLLTLQALEDDAMGEEWQVIWELEPGARVFEQSALPAPNAFDAPAMYDAFLDAVRWGTVTSADMRMLQSPFRSGITIEDYQLDPVVRAVQMSRANLLIADDVGLGKTIEAGLVVQEMLLRYRVRTVLIVCPSALQVQWRDQMRDKFGLEFRIVDTDLMRRLRRERGLHINPWTHFPRLITSIDFLKRERPLRWFMEALPESDVSSQRPFDLLIVDEAHNAAPSGRQRYITDSQRTTAIRRIAPHFEHKLFLSATPHNGYQESFTALLELLDNQRFARGVTPDPRQLQAVMVRRLKRDITKWDGTPRFPPRRLEALEVPYTATERSTYEMLERYTALRRAAASEREQERVATEFVLTLLKKRFFSSPEAFARTLARHRRTLATGGQHTAAARPSLDLLRRQIEDLDEDWGDDDVADAAVDETAEIASMLFRPVTGEEQALLDRLEAWAEGARQRPDSKGTTLINWLRKTLLLDDDTWNDERVIIFTEYRDTQRWLTEMLAADGLTTCGRLLTLYGGMPTDERERIKAAFQAHPSLSPVRILLATDAASEGIDLQRHCHRLVHMEIPWNPNRLEQRNGRVDRHGQTADTVEIYHFVGEGWERGERDGLNGDLEFLMRVVEKVEQIREDLGKVGPVIAAQVERAMLGAPRVLDTAEAEQLAAPARRMLRAERDLREQVERARESLDATRRQLHVSPESVAAVVAVALNRAGQPPLIPTDVPGLPPGSAWMIPALHGSWSACTEGLAHPHTHVQRPIVFDHQLADGRDDVVLAHLQHRLVQMAVRLLRAEVWASDAATRRLNRVTARIVPDDALSEPMAIAHGRLLVLGGTQARLHEEVIAAGGVLREGRLVPMGVREVERALDAAGGTAAPPALEDHLRGLWDAISGSLSRALAARSHDRSESLARLLAEREEKELRDSEATLTALQKAIFDTLKETQVVQLSLFTDDEAGQYQRDREHLRRRVERIPAEIEREAAAIHARFASPQPRVFPVGVTFLIPRRLAHV